MYYSSLDLFAAQRSVAIRQAGRIMRPQRTHLRAVKRKLSICLDPGHGGADSGATYGMTEEKTKVLQFALASRYRLTREDSCNVSMTRETDWKPTFTARADTARQSGASLAISIHINASNSKKANGLWLFHKHGCEESRMLCALASEFIPSQWRNDFRVFDAHDNPLVSGDDWLSRPEHVLRLYPCQAILVEWGFITNQLDYGYLCSPRAHTDFVDFVSSIVRAHAVQGAT